MRPTSTNVGQNIPAFLSKLWKMVNDPETDHLICWSPGGHSFIIQNEVQFWYNLLPIYYKHNNMSSFIRQLNMYGFHKISSENGGMDCDKDEIKFFHPFFQQDQPNLMKHIKRKIASSKQSTTSGEENKVNNVDQISKVLVDVKQLRGRQENVDSQLAAMKQENAALWRELALLRQKHMKQQQIVNKLIHFLVTIVQPSRGGLGNLGVKRRYPLMINDSRYSKVAKSEGNCKFDGPTIHELDAESALTDSLLLNQDQDKVNVNDVRIDSPPSDNVLLDIPISEETEHALNNDIDADADTDLQPLLTVNVNSDLTTLSDKDILRVAEQIASKQVPAEIEEPIFEDAKSPHIMKDGMISNLNLLEESESGKFKQKQDKNKSLTVATRSVPDLNNFKVNSAYSDELDNHLESTQGELDTIKDMLFEGYSLDANALLGNQFSNPYDAVPFQLFNPDEDFPLDIPPLTNLSDTEQNKNNQDQGNSNANDPLMSGSELTTYVNPPFFLDFENLFEDGSNSTTSASATATEATTTTSNDTEINTPVVVKKEVIYPVVKTSNTTM